MGDLYQLPSVEKGGREQQIYQGLLWSRFSFLELTEIVRVNPDAYRFAQLLSRARTAWTGIGPDGVPHAAHRADDLALLQTRLCSTHCASHKLQPFLDVQRVRPVGCVRCDQEVEIPQTVHHCPMAEGASVLASRCRAPRPASLLHMPPSLLPRHWRASSVVRCAKINELNAAFVDQQPVDAPAQGVRTSTATDTVKGTGELVLAPSIRTRIDAQLSGMLRTVSYYEGQHVLLTVNKRNIHADYANATSGRIVGLQSDPATGVLGTVLFRPDDWGDAPRAPIAVHMHRAECVVRRDLVVIRRQFPLIPAHAMTVRRHHAPSSPVATSTSYIHISISISISVRRCIVCRAPP